MSSHFCSYYQRQMLQQLMLSAEINYKSVWWPSAHVKEQFTVQQNSITLCNLLVAYWWCLPTDMSLFKSYLNYRDVYLFRVFIRYWRSENSPLIMQNSLANVWWPMTSLFSDVEPLLKYSPVALNLSPATRIFKENPASWRSMPNTGTWEKRCLSRKCTLVCPVNYVRN